jgi:sec-independent protein translocase protein TatA
MFGEHIPELMIILVIALLIFGPKKLPEMSGSIGKGIRAFNKALHEQPEQPEPPKEAKKTTATTTSQSKPEE